MTGLLIAFEGLDGCGKSTQAELLAQALGCEKVRMPGQTRFGREIRTEVLWPSAEYSNPTETLLMMADAAMTTDLIIAPELAEGRHVVSDRHYGSTMAYQGMFASGVNMERFFKWGVQGHLPDINFFIDIPVALSQERCSEKRADRFESVGTDAVTEIHKNYRSLATRKEWQTIPGTESKQQIHNLVCEILNSTYLHINVAPLKVIENAAHYDHKHYYFNPSG